MRSCPCFNGAATLSLRKHRAATLAQKARTRFNGAATLSLRKRIEMQIDYYTAFCFNGAATLSLRKPFQACNHPVQYPLLQWGRNFIVAETTCLLTPFTMTCFNGAATLSLRKLEEPFQRESFNGAATLSLRKHLQTSCMLQERNEPLLQWGRNFIVAETAPWGR